MIEVRTVGQRKPLGKITFINGFYVVMQMTAPVADNGNVSSYGTDLTIYTPEDRIFDSRRALSPDKLIEELAYVKSFGR